MKYNKNQLQKYLQNALTFDENCVSVYTRIDGGLI